MAERCVELLITGRVQGVGYRAFAAQRGTKLGLRGWVRNRPDGCVAARAAGPSEKVAELLDALQAGPALAKVDELRVRDCQRCGLGPGFEIRS